MSPIPFATIGTNWITHSFIASAHSTSSWTLSAVYSRNASTASTFCARYDSDSPSPITQHTSLASLAADPHILAVYIASPNSLHYTHAAQMLAAGKHVILEKPSTSTLAELAALFRLARAHGVFLLEAFRHLHEANFKLLKQSLGRIGTVTGASFTYAQFSSRYAQVLAGADPPPNIFSLEMSGGCLVDLGVYCVAAAVELFGEPDEAVYFPVRIATGADGGGHLVLEYNDDKKNNNDNKSDDSTNNTPTGNTKAAPFPLHISTSKIYTSSAPSEIHGTLGTLTLPSITDISSVTFFERATGTTHELGVARGDDVKGALNMREEALEFARIIQEGDAEAAERLEELSKRVLKVTEGARRGCGVVFGVEREGGRKWGEGV
ncbi:hypothetical protein BDV95DRAFT_581843 [Massariosphaeria phaeospora]|uniref:Uncharacterized protein n=1 Tax=Massariosphaeria phaeospora TaxID=100035 RepID=A0A7C8M9Y6_9PLEO|nr:hypothetical protein BDV95DRAFT_581843 [Massariosphaeria phaeospora]